MKPRRLCLTLGCLIFAGLVASPTRTAFAWGREGNAIIGLIADRLLQAHDPAVHKKVADILATDTANGWTRTDIAGEANWADVLLDKSPEGRAATSKWHYLKLGVADPDVAKACFGHPALPAMTPAAHGPPNDCLTDKIDEFARELDEPATSAEERLMALQFLLNLTGDLHQPLNVVEHNDQAGRCIAVLPPGARAPVRLSDYWNDLLVADAEGRDPAAAADRIVAGMTKADIQKWSNGTIEAWARESHNLAKSAAYALPPDAATGKRPAAARKGDAAGCGAVPVYRIDAAYQQRAIAAIREQLAKAGVRLAFILRQNL